MALGLMAHQLPAAEIIALPGGHSSNCQDHFLKKKYLFILLLQCFSHNLLKSEKHV